MNKEECLELLRKKQQQIGTSRLLQKSDFGEEQVAVIKAHLGPWPRALEAAGLKERAPDGKAERKIQKRINAKRTQTLLKAQKKENEKNNKE